MSLDSNIKEAVYSYVRAHLPNDDWYSQYFDFISDPELRERLAEEFKASRSVYKLFRGIDAQDCLQRAQVRIQILQYASIYEAVIHHILFDRLGTRDEVRKLIEFPRLIRISIPVNKQMILDNALVHDGKAIIPTYQGTGRTDITKVRFDDKANCAVDLSLIDQDLCRDLIEIYEARNAIHLHAELRKNLSYEIDLARTAYRRLKPFRFQLVTSLSSMGLLLEGVEANTEIEDED